MKQFTNSSRLGSFIADAQDTFTKKTTFNGYNQTQDVFNKGVEKTGKKRPFTSFILKHQKQAFTEHFLYQEY